MFRKIVAAVLFAGTFAMLAQATAQERRLDYDPAADPFEQLTAARDMASMQDKLVLVVAGGEWCIWCHYLHDFLAEHEEVDKALKSTFVVAKVYIGDEADNSAFFEILPEALGYPHFWILDADGEVLQSQNTLPLEDGDKSYDVRQFTAFVEKWSSR